MAVGYIPTQNPQQYVVINTRKELFDIALQYPTGQRIIFARDAPKREESIEGFMRTLSYATGERIGDEGTVKEGV